MEGQLNIAEVKSSNYKQNLKQIRKKSTKIIS